jgi:hypothetical protein
MRVRDHDRGLCIERRRWEGVGLDEGIRNRERRLACPHGSDRGKKKRMKENSRKRLAKWLKD